MRGKVIVDLVLTKGHRITPAYAGKSMGYGGQRLICEDHPRVCGEKAMLGRVQTTGLGSPPRVRGKAAGGVIIGVLLGITPACAGKSPLSENRSE